MVQDHKALHAHRYIEMIVADIPFVDAQRFLNDRNDTVTRTRTAELYHFLIERISFNASVVRLRNKGSLAQKGECEDK